MLHYKPEFPDRNDEEWLKTTKARYTEDGPVFEYEEVDISLIKPRPVVMMSQKRRVQQK